MIFGGPICCTYKEITRYIEYLWLSCMEERGPADVVKYYDVATKFRCYCGQYRILRPPFESVHMETP